MWKTENAPKDGSWILAIFDDKVFNNLNPVVVKWTSWPVDDKGMHESSALKADGIYSGWVGSSGSFTTHCVYPEPREPLYWQTISLPENLKEKIKE